MVSHIAAHKLRFKQNTRVANKLALDAALRVFMEKGKESDTLSIIDASLHMVFSDV